MPSLRAATHIERHTQTHQIGTLLSRLQFRLIEKLPLHRKEEKEENMDASGEVFITKRKANTSSLLTSAPTIIIYVRWKMEGDDEKYMGGVGERETHRERKEETKR